MSQSNIEGQKKAVAVSAAVQQSDNMAHALAGAGGGILSMLLTYPLITLSTRAQVESKRAHSTTYDAIRRIIQREGVSGLYSGLESALFGISVTNFVYYYWYEWTRSAFEKAAARAGRSSKKLTTSESMIAGAIAGSATVLITNPIWVVNTRMTARKSESEQETLPGAPSKKSRASTISTLMDLLRQEGPKALFAGVLPALILVINPILQYTIFEQLKNILERRRRMTPKDAFYLGALGKILATSITYPYITVKSRMHVASKDGPKESLNGSLKRIVKEEGFVGLYRGIGPKVTQSAITAAFLFAFKDVLYDLMSFPSYSRYGKYLIPNTSQSDSIPVLALIDRSIDRHVPANSVVLVCDQNLAPEDCSSIGEDIQKSVKKRGRRPKTSKTRVEARSSPVITGEQRMTSSTPQTPDPLYFPQQDRQDTASSPGDGHRISSNRRSRRARTGPNNYYDKTNYLGFGSDEEVSESSARPSPTTSRQPRFPNIAAEPKTSSCSHDRNEQAHVIYSAPHVQILKSSFSTLDDLIVSERACYSSVRSPSEYALKYLSKPPLADEILHVDFDRTETAAVLDLFSFYGFQKYEKMEIALSDQVIQAAHIYDISQRGSEKIWWHDSKVEVMARSLYERNLLATGTRSIGLWTLAESTHNLLELPRARSKKDRELVPTSLAWGTIKETGNILLAGMCEKGDGTLQTGLLAGWRIGEASITPMQFSPNSQNMFDIKWHPTLPMFAAATSIGHGPANKAYKDTRSLVRMYQPLSSKVCTMEFECPALDINDAHICPMNPSYVTASCTDGITYVWDHRRPDRILHKLQHGEPLNQIDETISREQADVGVRLSLWGDRIDEFYTGSSDGVLKRWDILRAPEDVLVQDTARFDEEIMCGAFSNDKSNLLVGDAAGGVHLLSPGPFTSNGGLSMEFKPSSLQPQLQMRPDGHVSNPESGIKAGADLLESGKLTRHPIFGVGQGPYYDGPFAAWARPENIPECEIAQARLKEEVQLRQLEGPPPECRIGLDTASQQDVNAQIKLAHIRNKRRYQNKRTRDGLAEPLAYGRTNAVNLVGDVPDEFKRRLHHVVSPPGSMPPNTEVIELVGDTDTEWKTGSNVIHFAGFKTALEEVEEELEEDFWWPPSGTIDANIREVDGI
ncbi:hypothetical protein CBS63078_8697 [Aspergillus niger]|nr:hypothetical protein CBS133816_10053 [Aspergillus niger]KAI2847108.1 hypothetical protein CBS12448_9390 [Aspergillus niger]KAI2888597.1 hypothetical protein CBS13152_6304 [Aspergillus niger]KAI2894723.1 hypothetical protein CBS63078_8697 [Aspergillus niger]KAI2943146.1 hypothetical protein CBS147321_4953 [Aspergillus niger]